MIRNKKCQILIAILLVLVWLTPCVNLAQEPKKEPEKKVIDPSVLAKKKEWRSKVKKLIAERKGYVYKLLHPESSAEGEDEALFQDIIASFNAQDWVRSQFLIESMQQQFSGSIHIERAVFLLPLCIRYTTEKELPIDYERIINAFRDALDTYPDSEYAPSTAIEIADIYFGRELYYDALIYYGIADHHPKFKMTPNILLREGLSMVMVGKMETSIEIFGRIVKEYPKSVHTSKAKVEIAKAHFQQKAYIQSQKILDEVAIEYPEYIYENSDILLYTGYNYYEQGDFKKAREMLSRVLNYFPNIEVNHLILTRIGDIYLEEGDKQRAIDIYNRVHMAYPETDGALISLLRLVEHVRVKPESRYSKNVISDITFNMMSTEVYESIIRNHEDSPLAHLAMLKMAIEKYENKLYESCIVTLKSILEKYPSTPLKKDVQAAMQAAVQAISIRDFDKKNYEAVIAFFDQYRNFLIIEDLTGKYMVVLANSYLQLKLYRRAQEIFENAQDHYLKKDRPADLLFGLGESSYFLKEYDKALSRFDEFITNFPNENGLTSKAYYRTALILYEQQQYEKATNNFELALKGCSATEKLEILMMLGRSLRLNERYGRAVIAFNERIVLLKSLNNVPAQQLYDTYYELGEAYYRLGDKKNAAFSFEEVLHLNTDSKQDNRTQFRLAECYQHLQVLDKAEAILVTISENQDPFWKKVAEAQLQEIRMNKKLQKVAQNGNSN